MSKAKTQRQIADNEAKGVLRSIRTSPRKLGLVAGLIRGRNVQDALIQLEYSQKNVARDVKKLLSSVVANAENNHNLDIDSLYVKEVQVGKGLVMKRFTPRGRGRASRILKSFSNISIVVAEKKEVK
jgi:large subunit ribosomal protein L22